MLADLIGANERLPTIDITGLTSDSRAVKPGYLFAALPGSRTDGTRFIRDAIASGAVAVLGPPGSMAAGVRDAGGAEIPFIQDTNPRRRLALLAARFFGAQPEVVVAVTGTNGKTSVVHFVRGIWEALGQRAASIGTLGVKPPDLGETTTLTTPEPVALHRVLASLAVKKVNHVAIEASSHGLDQYRVDGVHFAAAALTNVTRDHLDYHKSFDAYLFTKLRLFGEVMAPGGVAVLNADADVYGEADALCWARGHRVISVGTRAADLKIVDRTVRPDGTGLTIEYLGRAYTVDLDLVGDFQVSNVLVAAGLAIGCGADPEAVFGVLGSLQGVPGRLQKVVSFKDGSAVFVDYAHTPDALANALQALRPHTRGALHVLFGCGGDRDRGKRARMGEVAAALADFVTVTDDNPRSEDPAAIRAEIMTGCPRAREIEGRREAIEVATAALHPGDTLVVAGKGHETGQEIGGAVYPFDDAEAIRDVAAVHGARDG